MLSDSFVTYFYPQQKKFVGLFFDGFQENNFIEINFLVDFYKNVYGENRINSDFLRRILGYFYPSVEKVNRHTFVQICLDLAIFFENAIEI